MYCPAHFEENRPEVLQDLIARYPLATVVSQHEGALVADHLPLLFEAAPTGVGRLIGHVAKANPLWRTGVEGDCLIVFQGASHYISPGWYASKAKSGKVVPTWNYAVLHVHASMQAQHDPQVKRDIVQRLTTRQEAAMPQPWHVSDAPEDYVQRMLEAIVGVVFHIRRWQGKWKVSQNQPPENRQSLQQQLGASPHQHEQAMAALIEAFGKP